ncbi:MAG TPA: hypothetical protein VFG54_20280 [Prolixibacteraceae bacterium]|nr:hypothetical protein [Prolixibacteraceae bacterium]
MKKFAAHYLLTDTGILLKNGIAVTDEDGFVVEYIDTKGDIQELEQMIFHSGLLLGAFELERQQVPAISPFTEDLFQLQLIHLPANSDHIALHQLMDTGKVMQRQFLHMTIPDLLNSMLTVLLTQAGYVKKPLPGLYLLTGLDRSGLHFTTASRLKKIL